MEYMEHMKDFDATTVKNNIVAWIKEWFDNNGKGCNAVIGISGGKDSSVVTALCVEALGKDRVYGVMMPKDIQNDIGDSYALAEFLGINYMTVDIGLSVDSILCGISCPKNGSGVTISEQTRVNLPPRIRMATLYAVSQSVNGRVACTDNLSESFIGYSTRWGDNIGDFSPIASLTTDEVIAVGDACGLPYELTHKIPSDGLCGKTDEDNFGFTYAVLNKYIRTGVCDDEAVKEKVDRLHRANLFKLNPVEKFEY